MRAISCSLAAALLLVAVFCVACVNGGFNANSKSNYVIYWGQGYSTVDQSLRTYCTGQYDVIYISFLYKLVDPYVDLKKCKSPYFAGTSVSET